MHRKEDEDGHRELHGIINASQRAAELVQQLLTFSRKVESKLRPVNLNHEVEQTHKLLLRTIPKMIAIELHLADDLKIVDADPAQIGQVLMNLAVNARDAMPEGGKLTIATRNVVLDEEYCRSHVGVRAGDYVLVSISDTGIGMDRQTLEHIFEPFYTTKAHGKGTGLGLAMVYGIVKNHGGHVLCYSEPGFGTTFKIYLPVVEPVTAPFEVQAPQELTKHGSETILLVDDEELIRDFGKQLLESYGYTVLTAEDGEAALEVYRQERQHISLVLLDLIMPRMGGITCLEGLHRINPDLKVIVSSGYSPDGHKDEAITAGARTFLSKPYETRQLLQVIRKTLDTGP
jgi:CheY-like chemotaxis protein